MAGQWRSRGTRPTLAHQRPCQRFPCRGRGSDFSAWMPGAEPSPSTTPSTTASCAPQLRVSTRFLSSLHILAAVSSASHMRNLQEWASKAYPAYSQDTSQREPDFLRATRIVLCWVLLISGLNGDNHNLDQSGERNADQLPGHWQWERFKLKAIRAAAKSLSKALANLEQRTVAELVLLLRMTWD